MHEATKQLLQVMEQTTPKQPLEPAMSKVLELTDDQYETFSQAAAAKGLTPAELLAVWIEELREGNREAQHYETEDWFRHLGATEEQIAEAKRIAKERSNERSDANA